MIKKIPVPPNATEVILETYDPKIDFTIVEPVNQPPVISATSPGEVTLPVSEVVLKGSAHDLDGTIKDTGWRKISGPEVAISGEDDICTLTALRAGDYEFEFIATDDKGASTTQTVKIKVNPAPPAPTEKIFPITVTQRTDEYSRPGAGLMRWNYNEMVANVPAQDEYRRYAWFDFDKGTTGPAYNWSMFDSELAAAIKAGRKFCFAIMPLYSGLGYKTVAGGRLSFPEWVHNGMQKEIVKDWIFDGGWIQNWNSPFFLSAQENLLKNVYDRIVSKGAVKNIGFIDIRGYGEWGEWHSDEWTGKEPAGTRITTDTYKKIIDMHVRCFPDIQLIALGEAFDPGNYARTPAEVSEYMLSVKNKVGPVGWRLDHWGNPGLDINLSKLTNAAVRVPLMDRWKIAPVVGEPNNDTKNANFSDLPREMKDYHVSMVGNGNFPNASTAATNVKAAAKIMGYRLGISSGEVTVKDGKLIFDIDWENTGVAPTYESWLIQFVVGSQTYHSKFDPRLLIGKINVVDEFQLPSGFSGSYDLKINVTDITGIRKSALPLNTIVSCKINL